MIIAIKEKDKVVIGYSNGDSWSRLAEKDYVDQENVAIKFSEKGRVFACATMNKASDKLLYDKGFVENDDINPKSIHCDIIGFIKMTLGKRDNPDKEEYWQNTLLICDDKTIYDIDTRFNFYEVDDYVCHGYRVETLKSVLDATEGLPAEERILKAVKFVGKMHKESLFPLVITDTTSRKFKIVNEGEKTYECVDSL